MSCRSSPPSSELSSFPTRGPAPWEDLRDFRISRKDTPYSESGGNIDVEKLGWWNVLLTKAGERRRGGPFVSSSGLKLTGCWELNGSWQSPVLAPTGTVSPPPGLISLDHLQTMLVQGQDSGVMFHKDLDFFNVDHPIHCLPPHARRPCYELGMEELSSANIACFLLAVKQPISQTMGNLQVCARACASPAALQSWVLGSGTEQHCEHRPSPWINPGQTISGECP